VLLVLLATRRGQHPVAGLVEAVEHDGAGLGRVHHELLVVLVDGRLRRCQESCAHLNPFGAKRERGGHRTPVGDPAGSDHRDVYAGTHKRDQDHRGDIARRFEPAALTPFGNDPVDARGHGLQGRTQRGHHVEDRDAGFVQGRGEHGRITGGCGHEPDALVVHEVDDPAVANEELGDVDPKGLVGEITHARDLVSDLIELPGGCLDDPHAARVRDRRGEARSGDVTHRGLQDRVLDTQQVGDTCSQG
jgi:hypothetical protein